jgi:hypothetical protein
MTQFRTKLLRPMTGRNFSAYPTSVPANSQPFSYFSGHNNLSNCVIEMRKRITKLLLAL